VDPEKKPAPFVVPLSVKPEVAAQMWALQVMLRDQEKARQVKARIVEANFEMEK
jgi:hypothetical protein